MEIKCRTCGLSLGEISIPRSEDGNIPMVFTASRTVQIDEDGENAVVVCPSCNSRNKLVLELSVQKNIRQDMPDDIEAWHNEMAERMI